MSMQIIARRDPRTPRARWPAAAAWLFACAWLAATATLPARAEPLTLAVSRTSLSLPLFVAEAQGFFAAEGVSVRTQECVGGQRCIKQLFDGSAQVATASDLPIMFHSFERDDYAVIATFVTSWRDLKLVTRSSVGIEKAAHLAGKRVGIVKGSSSQYFLDAYLLFQDVDPKSVTAVALVPEALAPAFGRKEIDAVAVWEPWAWLSLKAAGGDARVLPSPHIYTQSFNLIADRRTIASREGELVAVLRAVERAQRFIREQPALSQQVMKQRLALEQDYVDWVWPHLDFRLGLDQSLISTLEGEARWALREGHVAGAPKTPNYLRYVEPGLLRKAVPGAVTTLR